MRSAAAALLALIAAALAAPAGEAQETGADTVQAAEPDRDARPDSVSGVQPAGAFLRGAVLPGWGHAATGSATRGAFYFSMEALSSWMVYKTHRRLGVARDQAALWEQQATAELMAQGVTDPDEIEAALEAHEGVSRFRGLVDARTEQREDWLALAVFTLLLSGVDAYVSAHLSEFPEPLTVEGNPISGAVEVSIRVPVG